MEIEKQSSKEIEQAENVSQKKIEAHRRALMEKKEKECARIIAEYGAMVIQAIEALKKRKEAEFLASGKDYESRFQDPALVDAVKEKIFAILLTE